MITPYSNSSYRLLSLLIQSLARQSALYAYVSAPRMLESRAHPKWSIAVRPAIKRFQSLQATFMSAAVDVPETEVVSWPVAPAVSPAAPDPMWSVYHVVFTG